MRGRPDAAGNWQTRPRVPSGFLELVDGYLGALDVETGLVASRPGGVERLLRFLQCFLGTLEVGPSPVEGTLVDLLLRLPGGGLLLLLADDVQRGGHRVADVDLA